MKNDTPVNGSNSPPPSKLIGGFALREAIKTGSVTHDHQFEWSKEEVRQLGYILNGKFQPEAIHQFISRTQFTVFHFGESLSNNEKFYMGRAQTISQGVKALEQAKEALNAAAYALDELCPLSEVVFNQKWNNDLALIHFKNNTPSKMPPSLIRKMEDAARDSIREINTNYAGRTGAIGRNLFKADMREIRAQLVFDVRQVYEDSFNKKASTTIKGVFDQILTFFFETLGFPAVVDKRDIIKHKDLIK